jgi:hypothetical protein
MDIINDTLLRSYLIMQNSMSNLRDRLRPETGAEFIQIVFFVAVFVVPIGILFWAFQGTIQTFWTENVVCRFTGNSSCGTSTLNPTD